MQTGEILQKRAEPAARALDLAAVERETGRRLITPAELECPPPDLSPRDLAALREAYAWVREVIFRRVQKSATRNEAVCPFAEPSVDAGLFFLSVGRPRSSTEPSALADEVRLYGEIFQRLEPREGSLAMLRCIVLVLPDAPHELILPAVDPNNSPVETELLERDVMVGEFYRDCPFPATWDPHFFPLQSPLPLYVFRPFIKTDWRLIHRVKAWREIYKRRFGEPAKGDQHRFPAVIGWYAERVAARIRLLLGR
jgi:heptaprenyl diphosphate synthase